MAENRGFDACIDRNAPDWRAQFDAATPNGVDVDFENVGGEVMDHVFMRLNLNARIILCGMISQYDAAGTDSDWQGQVNVGQILMQRATMRGFIVGDHADQFPAGFAYLSELYADGRLSHDETIVEGFDEALTAMRRLFTGEKTGKLLVHVADPT
jgi:NADPH2:quinone reductase